jgi:hypothetical protein
MATKLDKALKRELDINGEAWMLTIMPEGLKLVPKGKRNGHEVAWKDIISGSTALTGARHALLAAIRRRRIYQPRRSARRSGNAQQCPETRVVLDRREGRAAAKV